MRYSASTAVTALCAMIGTFSFAAENKEKTLVPYYLSGGGFVGNGGDELTMVPENSLGEDDAVVPLPQELMNFGFVRIDASEEDRNHESISGLRLTKCRGGSVSKQGYYIGKSGSCTRNFSDDSFQLGVEINKRTQIQPGLYQLTTNPDEEGRFEAYPGIIRVVKGKTTVIPLPKIILPEISRNVSASIYSDFSAQSMQLAYAAAKWIGQNRAEECGRLRRGTYAQPRGLFAGGGHNRRPLEFDQASAAYCQAMGGSDWRNSFKYFTFANGESADEIHAFEGMRGIVRLTTDSSFGRDLGLQFALVTSGKSVITFPGIYRLEFEADYGAKTKSKGINVGNFSASSINKVYPN